MTASTGNFCGDGNDDMMSIGLVASHAYSLLAAHDLTKNGQPLKLVELRNPWGKGEWKGAYSDESPEWTPELKQKLAVHDDDDGIFYMPYNEFLKYYSDVQICKIHDDYRYTSLRVNSNCSEEKWFKVTVPSSGKYFISVN